MLGRERIEIEETVSYPTTSGEYPVATQDIEDYITTRVGIIAGADDVDEIAIDISYETTSFESEGDETTVSVSGDYTIEGLDSGGTATIVTPDGYFLTAAHVVESKQHRLVFSLIDIDTKQPETKVFDVRTVYINEEADFAIIKAELKFPLHFRLEEEVPIKVGDEIYAGGILWPIGYGLIEQVDEKIGEAEMPYLTIKTSTPLLRGDSGGPAVDNSGRLLGIAKRVYFGRGSPYSVFTMLDRKKIQNIIASDRAKFSDKTELSTTQALP